MDFNYLYFRQQVEIMRADKAGTMSARSAHRRMAGEYTKLIDSSRADAIAELREVAAHS